MGQLESPGGRCPRLGVVGQAGDAGLVRRGASSCTPRPGQEQADPSWVYGLQLVGTGQKGTPAPGTPLCRPNAPRRGSRLCCPLFPQLPWPGELCPTECCPTAGTSGWAPPAKSWAHAGDPSPGIPWGGGPGQRGVMPAGTALGTPCPRDEPWGWSLHPPAPTRGVGVPLAATVGWGWGVVPAPPPHGRWRPRRRGSAAPLGGGKHTHTHTDDPAFRWAPPLWLLLQAARSRAKAGAGGEAPPHPDRHRPFKEGEILHINKRGPRERGGLPFPEVGWGSTGRDGLGSAPPPQLPPLPPGRAGLGRGILGLGRGGGCWGEGGALKQPGSVSQVRTSAGGEAQRDPPPRVRGRGRREGGDGRPRGGTERLRIRIRRGRQAGNGASGAGRARWGPPPPRSPRGNAKNWG